jgi:hypothetical protein
MESSAFPDKLVREIAVLTPNLGPEMAGLTNDSDIR